MAVFHRFMNWLEIVTIAGCGGRGLAAIQGVVISRAGKIIAVDLQEKKQTLGRKFRAPPHTLQNRHDVDGLTNEIIEITWGMV